jgi:hypothetical protein
MNSSTSPEASWVQPVLSANKASVLNRAATATRNRDRATTAVVAQSSCTQTPRKPRAELALACLWTCVARSTVASFFSELARGFPNDAIGRCWGLPKILRPASTANTFADCLPNAEHCTPLKAYTPRITACRADHHGVARIAER